MQRRHQPGLGRVRDRSPLMRTYVRGLRRSVGLDGAPEPEKPETPVTVRVARPRLRP